MNTKRNFQETRKRGTQSARRLNFKLAAVLASVCVGAGLLLPAIKNHNAHQHAMPPGRFQADMRTLAAAVSYLLAPDPVTGPQPVFATGIPSVLAHGKPGQKIELEAPANPSDEPETETESAPNPPAPI